MESDLSLLPSLGRKAEELARRRKPLPADPEELALRNEAFRRHLIRSLGYMPPRESELSPAVMKEGVAADDVAEELVAYQAEPHRTIPAQVCRPMNTSGRLPGVLILHAWDLDKTGLDELKVSLARRGVVVLTPRTRCSNEHEMEVARLDEMDADTGTTVMGLITFDNMRALDYLSSRADVDPERLAVVGVCWSGIQSYLLAALDERVKVVSAVCGMSVYGAMPTQNTFVEGHTCVSTFVPGLLDVGQVQDIMALIAPRPLLVQNNVSDAWLPILGFRTLEDEMTTVYRALGHPERFQAKTASSTYDLTPAFTERMVEWLGRFLKPSSDAV